MLKMSFIISQVIFILLTFSTGGLLILSIQCTVIDATASENDTKLNVYSNEPMVYDAFGILHTPVQYSSWSAAEETVIPLLTRRQELIKEELQLIQRYLNDYQEIRGTTQEVLKKTLNDTSVDRGGSVVSRTALEFRTRRFTVELYQLQKLYNSLRFLQNQGEVNVYMELQLEGTEDDWIDYKFVGEEDMFMSMNAFIHLSEVYSFQPAEMTRGIEFDTSAGGQLNALHAAEIGVFSLLRKKQSLSVQWLEWAQDTMHSTLGEVALGKDVVSQLLRMAIQNHNKDRTALSLFTQKYLKDNFEIMLALYLLPIKENEPPESRKLFRQIFYRNSYGLGPTSHPEAQFMDLCSGNEPQTPKMQRNLRCYYERQRDPYLYINPVKTEQLSEEPPVFQFYEMVGNGTIELIKRENTQLVVLSEVRGSERVPDLRTSVGTFLPVQDTPTMVHTLAEAVTGLRIRNSSERIQYAEYTYGRYYGFHSDVIDADYKGADVLTQGNRMATILYYLELPELGGLTPMCQAGINARPVRGSAIFWYNVYRNGLPRLDVTHGACPVVHGYKIIMNHWVRYNGNWDTFPCSLNQFE